MGLRERVFARRPARQQSQTEMIANTIIKVALLFLLIATLIAIGMHYL